MQFSNGEDLTSHTSNSVVGVSSLVASGATRGSYQLQLRLREVDEFAGSVVRYADLRYATDAIVRGDVKGPFEVNESEIRVEPLEIAQLGQDYEREQ